jgi:hypothetical protein
LAAVLATVGGVVSMAGVVLLVQCDRPVRDVVLHLDAGLSRRSWDCAVAGRCR